MVNQRTLTDDGLEVNFATNTLGMYILTNGLLDSITDRQVFFNQALFIIQNLFVKILSQKEALDLRVLIDEYLKKIGYNFDQGRIRPFRDTVKI